MTTYAQDAYGRTASNGWGTADVGGSWSHNNAVHFDVGSGVGTVTVTNPAGDLVTARLASVSASDVDFTVDVQVDTLATGSFDSWRLRAVARRVDDPNCYQAVLHLQEQGNIVISLRRILESVDTGLTFVQIQTREGAPAANTVYHIRFQVEGASPTTLRAKAWKAGNSEPSAWDVETTDGSSALQGAQSVGLFTTFPVQTGTLIASFDNLLATDIGAAAGLVAHITRQLSAA